MKKIKTMRIASILLIAVLMTTCAISGTFAKYVTDATGSDSARVAKWGVSINAGGAMFAKSENGTTVTNTVLSENNVVAPGMSGTMAAIEVSGTPEVAVNISHTATVTITGWMLGQEFYCPIVVTVDNTAINGLDYNSADEFARKIKEAIDGHSKDYTAGTTLTDADNVDVSWSWAFNGTGNQTDAKDTLVADVEATIEISIKTTVAQINS